jgi:hypothetical protein
VIRESGERRPDYLWSGRSCDHSSGRRRRKGNVPDGKDREEWDRLWGARTQRLLPGPCRLDVGRQWPHQKLTAVTIADDPPEFAARVCRGSEDCPVCGRSTAGCARVPASLDVTFEDGLSLGIGVWAHESCFDSCSDTGVPARIPW